MREEGRAGEQWDKRAMKRRETKRKKKKASGGFALTQSRGVNQRAGQSTDTQMGLHADGATSPHGVNHAAQCVCVCYLSCEK